MSAHRHLGHLVKTLRQRAGLLRADLASAVGVSTVALRNLEIGRGASLATIALILKHPALVDLPTLAREAGIVLPSPPPATGR